MYGFIPVGNGLLLLTRLLKFHNHELGERIGKNNTNTWNIFA